MFASAATTVGGYGISLANFPSFMATGKTITDYCDKRVVFKRCQTLIGNNATATINNLPCET